MDANKFFTAEIDADLNRIFSNVEQITAKDVGHLSHAVKPDTSVYPQFDIDIEEPAAIPVAA